MFGVAIGFRASVSKRVVDEVGDWYEHKRDEWVAFG